jgi:hypothetical protein
MSVPLLAGQTLHLRASQSWSQDRINFRLYAIGPGKTIAIAEPIVMRTLSENEEPSQDVDSTFSVTIDEARRVMDCLWLCGIRPSNQFTIADVATTEAHIKDLRKIAFKLLKIEAQQP